MKKILSIGLLLTAMCVPAHHSQAQEESLNSMIDRGLKVATEQSLQMVKTLESKKGQLPKTIKDGKLSTSDCYWWCSGFFPGELWYLYENNPTPELKKYAEEYTSMIEPVQYVTNNHDVGFMLNCSYGNGYRITKNPKYKKVLLTGAQSLSTRYNPLIKAIKSWDNSNGGKWQYPVIIDNMMNLELLEWATKEGGDKKFDEIARNHANTTMKNHFRPDYSSYHVVSYDTITGRPHVKMTHQGYADESAWARGQAWAVYGYTMMARETGDKAYLDQARHIAAFLMNHPNMPADKVPYWDFNAPNIPNAVRDASAAAIMASALIDLSQQTNGDESQKYLDYAIAQLRSLSSPAYLAKTGTNCNFVLEHSTGHLPGNSEVDVPLSYADYYYVEALTRLKNTLQTGVEDRAVWVETITKIADPVLTNLSNNTLKKNMPFESLSKPHSFSHLEAVGRLICGIAPWLELGPDATPEGQLRAKYIELARKGLKNAVDPKSPDYLVFGQPYQPLVDAAFLAQGLLRAPKQLWDKMDKETQQNMITELKRSRNIKPWESNWLLFASMVEATLLEYTGECDMERLTNGVNKFKDEWYKGDSQYGDGPAFHMDYYNSFVIHPLFTDVLLVMKKHNIPGGEFADTQIARQTRYAEILERFISPEGTFPVVGRSIVYRVGAFHALTQASLKHILPVTITPAQVRSALTAVIKNQYASTDNFDQNGWLKVGFTGEQIEMSESYINTGSLYLCAVGFLPLGLPADDPFWSTPYAEWTNKKAWSGQKVKADHAMKN